MTSVKRQALDSQRGEIAFRRKLVQQQVEGEVIFDDELDAEGIERILESRMKITLEQMTWLRDRGIALSPYVEIGAERGQRSLVMENDLGASGAAVDISYDALKSCEYYSRIFGKNRLPLRICCDASSLPFVTASVPFVFCYQTLHHFPDPAPVVEEIHRILSPGGCFLLSEEPYKRILHLNLYKKRVRSGRISTAESIREFLDYYLSEMTCNEVEHGITENFSISVGTWRRALSAFGENQVKLQAFIRLPRSVKLVESDLFKPESYVKFILAYLFGGEISGICRKSGVGTTKTASIRDVLICPACMEEGCESELIEGYSSFCCQRCGAEFPIVNGVVFLFSYTKFEALYPEVLETITRRGDACVALTRRTQSY